MDTMARYRRRRLILRGRYRRWVGGVVTLFVLLLVRSDALQPVRPAAGLFGRRATVSSSSTQRRMVLTTPEAIFEQASTQKLLDDLIDESVRTSARRPIMMQFDPSSGWIWKRWKGTIFSETWDSCVARMIYACVVLVLYRTFPGIKDYLKGFNILWQQLLSVTTFTLTFFLNTSFGLWRKCYELSRRLQGRLHDLDMTLAAHAARRPPSKPHEPTTYTTGSRQILDLISRYVRLFNLLTYASFTRSHRPLLTPRGLRRLVERGLMTHEEREVLVSADIPATQRHNAVLLWIIRVFVEGREAGHFHGGAGFEEQFLEKVHVTRAQYGAIGDELQGRMVLAYAHIVQVLVDLVLWMYPFMAVSSGMSEVLCVLGTGLLTVSYQGLCDLAKQFLDPYDNESYGKGEDPLVVDTLIAETNAGSIRWVNGLEEMPISSQSIKDGELTKFILPVRGYSVEELEQMERDKQEKERELQELREREEAERRRAEELENMVQSASEAMISLHMNDTSSIAGAISGDVKVEATKGKVRTQLPGAIAMTNLSVSQDLSQFITDAFKLNGAIPQALVPGATALANHTVPEEGGQGYFPAKIMEEVKRKDLSHAATDSTTGSEERYVEVVANGEVKLGKVSAGEVREEKLAAKEEPVVTAEESLKTLPQLQDGEKNELSDSQEIVTPMAGTGGVSTSDDATNIDADQTPIHDQQTMSTGATSLVVPQNESVAAIQPPGELTFPATEVPANTTDLERVPVGPSDGPEATEDLEPSVVSQPLGDGVVEQKSEETAEEVTGEGWSDTSNEPVAPPTSDEFTYEDYERRVEEILRAEQEELLETQAILNAPPGANSLDVPEKPDTSEMMNTTEAPYKLALHPTNTTDPEPTHHEDTGDPGDTSVVSVDLGRSVGSQTVGEGDTEPKNGETGEDPSQILSDEGKPDIEDDESIATPASDEYTFEDYERRVEEILRAEQEELLETQAILNAPPGANSLDVPVQEEPDSVFTNTTEPQDDLAVLEMDIPTNGTDLEPVSVGYTDAPGDPEPANALSEVDPTRLNNEQARGSGDAK